MHLLHIKRGSKSIITMETSIVPAPHQMAVVEVSLRREPVYYFATWSLTVGIMATNKNFCERVC